ncbi:uncharacterized protein METZ01_LOCUS366263 [marine metagenome]|uniref:Uncharacterized protein n=1 Tax=marine metagenome TaxID=408172 RepID=A0A382SU29_9ZZZZ
MEFLDLMLKIKKKQPRKTAFICI